MLIDCAYVFYTCKNFLPLLVSIAAWQPRSQAATPTTAEGKSKNTIYKWLRVKALEHFRQLKKAKKFDTSPKFPLYSGKEDEAQQKAPRADREMDIASMIDMIDLERDRLVLEKIDVEGVAIENLGRMPRQFGLSVRSIRSDISRVAASIAAGKQVIVAVDGGELIGNPFEEALEDILVGDIPLTVSLETFLDAWEDTGFCTIEVGRK